MKLAIKSLKDNGSTADLQPKHISEFAHFRKAFFSRKIVIIGFVIITLLIFAAIFASLISPFDPYKINMKAALQQPNAEHWLGTDQVGRDTLSRIIYGSRTSLLVGIVAVGIATIIGIALGLVTGYFGGWLDIVLMRIIDAQMAIPGLMLAMVFTAVLGGGLKNVMIAIGISMVPTYARLMRGQVITKKQDDYILAARSIGVGNERIMLKHIIPNSLPPMIVLVTLNLGTAILSEAGLSFIGIGLSPPAAAWGSMVSDGYGYLRTNPMLSLAPGLCILMVVLSFSLVGDGLRDALDPRLRGTL